MPGTMPNGWQPPPWPPSGSVNGAHRHVDPTGSAGQTHTILPTPNSGNGTAVQPTSPFGAIPLLYPYLIPNPGNRAEPWLLWDVRHAPSTAKRVAPRTVVLSAVDKFKEPATHPPVSCVHIAYNTNTIGMINYWGPIVVDKGEGGTVLVEDVLDAIFDFFQRQLLQTEAAVIKRDFPGAWRQMMAAYEKRCRDAHGIFEAEWLQGMRRVDCFGERHMWWGMWVTHNANGTYQLNLGLVPKKQRYAVPRLVSRRRR